MNMRHPEFVAKVRRSILSVSQRLGSGSRTLSRQLITELQRLNSARMGRVELSLLTPSARVRAVKAALVKHHEENPRCC